MADEMSDARALERLVEAVRPLLETIIEKQHKTRWAGHYVAMEDLDGPFREAFRGVISATRHNPKKVDVVAELREYEKRNGRVASDRARQQRMEAHDRDMAANPRLRRDIAILGGDPSL